MRGPLCDYFNRQLAVALFCRNHKHLHLCIRGAILKITTRKENVKLDIKIKIVVDPNVGHVSRYCRNLRNEEGNVAVYNIDDCSKMRNLDKKDDNHCSSNQIILQSDDIALTSNSSNMTSKTEWFIDSAASSHMTYDKTILMDFVSYGQPTQVFLGDDTVISATGEGKVRLPTHNDDVYIALNKVLFVPKLAKNVLSVHAMTKMGAEVTFDKEKCVILKDSKKFTVGHILDGKLYRVNTHEYANFTATCNVPSVELWHLRLGHWAYGVVVSMFDFHRIDRGSNPGRGGKIS